MARNTDDRPPPAARSQPPPESLIAVPGETCWRRAAAERVAVLVDGAAYHRALRAALPRARSSIWILAWDIDSRLDLRRDQPADEWPDCLGELLFELVERRPGLEVFVLEWDFAILYATERELSPIFRKARWRRHPRLHFRLDACHPVGASHHQKVVVVDDRLAFAGGMDLSRWRWDTPEHRPDDPRRVDPSGDAYPPHHDVQLAVEGAVAGALGELARERWRRAGGVPPPPAAAGDGESPWPADLAADAVDVEVAIARTEPPFEGRPGVREAEALTLAAIGAAERWIYLESQYLSATSVTGALAARLAEDDPPEVVLVLPYKRTGWLEEYTLGLLRSRCLRRLRSADGRHRLRVYYPHVPGLAEQVMNVHAKVVVVDHRFLRVGSSNLCNRSLGLDSECDLAIEPPDRGPDGPVRRVLVRLLADQVGADEGRVAETLQRTGRLIETIEALRVDGGRCLAPLDGLIDERLEAALPETAWLDPEQPAEVDRVVDELVGTEQRTSAIRRLLAIAAWIGAFGGLAALWRFSPLGDLLEPAAVAAWLRAETSGAGSWAVAFVGFVVAAVLAVPVSFLVVATAVAFGGLQAFLLSWVASVTSAWLSYALGSALGREVVRKISGRRLNRLSRRIARGGVVGVAALRVVPVAPFVIVNMVMGAAGLPRRDYLVGTALGMAPGVVAISFFVDEVVGVWRSGDPLAYATAGVIGLALLAAIVLLRRFLVRRGGNDGG